MLRDISQPLSDWNPEPDRAPASHPEPVSRLQSTDEVVAACAARPDVQPYARLVGRWVWVEFPAKPSPDTLAWLKVTGFRWNKQRLAWQHPCGIYCRRNRHADPRDYYGQAEIEQQQPLTFA